MSVNGAARIGQPSKGSLRFAVCTWGYLHSAMRIVRVPRFQAFRIPSLAIGESIVYHELLHDTFTLYPLLKAPTRYGSRILELYHAYTHGRLMALWVGYCII